MNEKRLYVVYDGRAVFDTDDAMVLEALGEYADVPWRAARSWRGQGAQLWSYDLDGTDERHEGAVR